MAGSISTRSTGSSDLLCVPNSLGSDDLGDETAELPATSQLLPALYSGSMVECAICIADKPSTVSNRRDNSIMLESCLPRG